MSAIARDPRLQVVLGMKFRCELRVKTCQSLLLLRSNSQSQKLSSFQHTSEILLLLWHMHKHLGSMAFVTRFSVRSACQQPMCATGLFSRALLPGKTSVLPGFALRSSTGSVQLRFFADAPQSKAPAVPLELVKELRTKTLAGYSDCKKVRIIQLHEYNYRN